jgi:hypothetical protein
MFERAATNEAMAVKRDPLTVLCLQSTSRKDMFDEVSH